MIDDFRLLMIGAMYENGGNTVQRLLDGHPQLAVYPYESQLGTRFVNDRLTSMFPVKYRWPVFALDASPTEDYRAILDEELKVRARTPHVSKFRDWPLELDDDERLRRYVAHIEGTGRSRAANVAAFFRATFEAWKNFNRSGCETAYVGYSPIITVDAAAILADFPNAHFIHVVRNPWSAYAETKRRPVPMSLGDYLLAWCTTQYHALLSARLQPESFSLVRFEDVVEDREAALGNVCARAGIGTSRTLAVPSWNGEPLEEVYPWGTIRSATPEANRATAAELSAAETAEIRERARPFLEPLGYESFV
jgi:hypothetical protein